MPHVPATLWTIGSLILLVRQEMAAHRLYIIIPRFLALIDELTNRGQLRRYGGHVERVIRDSIYPPPDHGMRPTPPPKQLAEVQQPSYTLLLTTNIYQGLKLFIPEDLMAGDTRSVHFLLFPEMKEYFDEVVQRGHRCPYTVRKLYHL
jgi:isoleucyl-tRNA synthetase